MITAIDTNVVSSIWSGEATAGDLIVKLSEARSAGAVLLSPFVYAELHAYPGASRDLIEQFIAATGIAVDYQLTDSLWMEAGRRFSEYAERRRRLGGGTPRRILPDFLIGSHALTRADCLLTLDDEFYQTNFAELKLR